VTARERWSAVTGTVLLVSAAFLLYSEKSAGPREDFVLETQSCRLPATLLRDTAHNYPATTLVFHGLSSNRRVMLALGESIRRWRGNVYLFDLPGHGDSTEPFRFERADQCAREAVEALLQRGDIQLERTIFLGHSMGGDIAIRLADYFPGAATIAVSPGPLMEVPYMPEFAKLPFTPPRRMPANLLMLMAQLDPWPIRPSAQKLLEAAGGRRAAHLDFREKRAVDLRNTSLSTHASIVFNPDVATAVNDWIGRAIGEDAPALGRTTGRWLLYGVLGILAICAMLPAAATLVFASPRARLAGERQAAPLHGQLLLWILTGAAAVILLRIPGASLRLVGNFSGDYLAAFLLLVGTSLLAYRAWKSGTGKKFDFSLRDSTFGLLLGVAVMLGLGAWINWMFADLWLTSARWPRFLPLLFLCAPYAVAEEIALGLPDNSRGDQLRRLGHCLLLRLLLWIPLVAAVAVLGSKQILLFLLAIPFLLLTIGQRLGTDVIRSRTNSLPAAVAFHSVLAAWFICAVFPLF
jgi:pimeloyl-ACP methyl ester carboxylesterase